MQSCWGRWLRQQRMEFAPVRPVRWKKRAGACRSFKPGSADSCRVAQRVKRDTSARMDYRFDLSPSFCQNEGCTPPPVLSFFCLCSDFMVDVQQCRRAVCSSAAQNRFRSRTSPSCSSRCWLLQKRYILVLVLSNLFSGSVFHFHVAWSHQFVVFIKEPLCTGF